MRLLPAKMPVFQKEAHRSVHQHAVMMSPTTPNPLPVINCPASHPAIMPIKIIQKNSMLIFSSIRDKVVPAEELFHLCRHGCFEKSAAYFSRCQSVGSNCDATECTPSLFLPSNGVNGFHPFRLMDGVNMDAMRLCQQALGSQQNAENVGTQMLIQRFSRLPLFEKVEKVFDLPYYNKGRSSGSPPPSPSSQPSKEAFAPVLSVFPEAHAWLF
jgi:hypothetical protein